MGRSSRPWSIVAVLILSAGAAAPAQAYVRTVTPSGSPIHWPSGFTFNLAGNPTNTSGLAAGDFFSAVTRSLQRWQSASGGSVNFGYWQGTDRSVYEPDSNYNGLNSVYFASNGAGSTGLAPNILGLTQVWYDSGSGEILEADTVLNDLDFTFTTNPTDTSGFGSPAASTSSARANVFIENVLTHEFGHSLGLAHSAGLQTTMLFMESPEQAHLGCDEQIAIRDVYPGGDRGARGAISGTVVGDGGSPLFGAYVEAISRRRGTSLGGGITDPSGHFSIGALEPGTYYLMAEPYLAGSAALPSYYGSINTTSCGGQAFHRSFLTDSSGHDPQAVEVSAGGTANAPELVAHCAAVAADTAGVVPVTVSSADPSGFGIVDLLSGGAREYQLPALSGHVEIHALSYSLYSPIHVTLELLTAQGEPAPGAQVTQDVYVGDSGYVNYDSAVIADGLPAGDYVLSVTPQSLSAEDYPAGPIMIDTSPFMLLTGSVNEAAPPLEATLPFNARCRMDENFAAYQSPPGNPPRASTDGDSGVGFCGTIAASGAASGAAAGLGGGGGGGSGGDGPGAGAIAGWLLPWLLMGALARAARRVEIARLARRGELARVSRPLLAGAPASG